MNCRPISLATTLLAIQISLTGCESGDTGTIDPGGTVPRISEASISPDTVNVDTLTASGGVYTVSTVATVRASDPDGDLSQVIVRAIGPDSSEPLTEAVMRDDGVNPDRTANDGLFSGTLDLRITRPETGPYRLQMLASDGQGLSSSALEVTLSATRRNSPPSLDTGSLVAPDTVQRPPIGTALYFMSIAAADSDGLADIKEVYFINLNSPSQLKQFLLDDGGAVGPGGVSSGDLLAGDGVFSIIFQVPSTVPTGLYRFAFQSEDSFGDTSATFIHELIVE